MVDERETMIAAERRRKIYDWALQHGSVKVAWLAESLGVGANTIRHDLDALHREGKLIRSHGGAVIKEAGAYRPPYSEIRGTHLAEKALIGEAAAQYIPETGSIYIGAGSTAYQLAIRVPERSSIHVVTPSPEVAVHLASRTQVAVDLLGGRVRRDSFATDASLSEEALGMMFWDITFMGVSAIDLARGITSIDRGAALYERKIIEHGGKAIVLCDSSKIGRFSYATVGPVGLIDILITDHGISPEITKELGALGVKVVLVGGSHGELGQGAQG